MLKELEEQDDNAHKKDANLTYHGMSLGGFNCEDEHF